MRPTLPAYLLLGTLLLSGVQVLACGGDSDSKSEKNSDSSGVSVEEICKLNEETNDAMWDSGFEMESCKEKYQAKKKELGDKGWAVFAKCRKKDDERMGCMQKGLDAK